MFPLQALNKYFIKYKWRLILGLVFIILTNYFKILAPQLTGYIINQVVAQVSGLQPTWQGMASLNIFVKYIIDHFHNLPFQQKILFAGLLLLGTSIVSGVFMFMMRQTIIVMSRLIEYDQKNEIYQHYQRLDQSFYKQQTIGDLMNRISEDVSKVRMYTGPAIMYFINLAAVISFSVFFMWRADPKLTIVALVPLPILAIIIYFVNRIIDKKSDRIQVMLSALTTNAQETFSGIRVIKSYVQERSMFAFFKRQAYEYKDAALSLAKTEAVYFPAMALLIGVSTIITVMVGALDVINNVPGSSIGKIAEFVMYIQMLTFPVSAIGWTASMAQRAAASQRRINEFLDKSPDIIAPLNSDLKVVPPIEFNKVSFTYPETGITAISDLNLKIEPGQKVAVIGKTGSGKSTLASLLLRFYDPESGNIFLNENNLKHFSLEQLRTAISYVPQEVFLFSDSIENNIRFGLSGASDEQVVEAAKLASVYEEIMRLPQGFKTVVGERGITLSGGQKQRISIARALIKDPDIIVLDDCLSAVDAATERTILNNLNEYFADKTAIVITHRAFSLMRFDNIVVLDDGKLVQQGTHQQLVNVAGHYKDMYLAQQKSLHQ